MRILYVFPHPDDESFGPAPVINRQVENDHQVFLLTLTKGGATKMRHKLGLSVVQMEKSATAKCSKLKKCYSLQE